jgi:hypothetical protein
MVTKKSIELFILKKFKKDSNETKTRLIKEIYWYILLKINYLFTLYYICVDVVEYLEVWNENEKKFQKLIS